MPFFAPYVGVSNYPLFFPRKKSLSVENTKLIIEGATVVSQYSFVSAIELATMGGCPTKYERAGSRAFEFIRMAAGQSRGRRRPFFLFDI